MNVRARFWMSFGKNVFQGSGALLALSAVAVFGQEGPEAAALPEPSQEVTTGAVQPGSESEETGPFVELPPVENDDFSALREGSPFLRIVDPAEKYVLRAVTRMDDEQIATLQDRESKKTILVTPSDDSEEGLRLVEVTPARDLEGVTATITFAGQEVDFKYDSSQISPTGVVSRSSKGGGGGDDGKRKGPSKEDIERYKSLSDDQRNKLRGYIGHVMKSYPNISREERGNMIRGAMIRLKDGRDLDFPKPENRN